MSGRGRFLSFDCQSLTGQSIIRLNFRPIIIVLSAIILIHYADFYIIDNALAVQAEFDWGGVERNEYFGLSSYSETEAIFIKMGIISYEIPRKYIYIESSSIPTLRVTIPGLNPMTEQTRACFDSKVQEEKSGCMTIELRLHGGIGPDGEPTSSVKMFRNFMNNFKNVIPVNGPFGYVVYDIGPTGNRIEVYENKDKNIYFICQLFVDSDKKDAICDDTVSLYDGNIVKFFFKLNKIKDIPEIETGIRKLMSSFVVMEGVK